MRGLFVGILLALLPKAAVSSVPSPWVQVRTAHFVVLCDAGEKEALRLATQFERMHAVFQSIFPAAADDADAPPTVLAVRDRSEMQQLEPAAYRGKGHIDLAGLFLRQPEDSIILVRLDAGDEHAFSTVYHEYTHYLLRRSDAWLPLWLNEGLAQFYENTEIAEKQVLLGETNAAQLRTLRLNPLLPIATLLTIDTHSPYYHDEQQASIFYAESWALTHCLLTGDRANGTHRIRDYADRLQQGEDAVTAAHHAFGDLDALETALSGYIAQRSLPDFALPAAIPSQNTSPEMRAVSSADADALRARVAIYNGRMEQAQTLLDAALREDPDNAPAHQAMGLLHSRQSDLAAASKWYSEAMRLDPRSYTAQYDFATTVLRAGAAGEDEAIESALRESIRLNPQFAPANDALAMFYASRPRSLDQAYALSLRAIELEPGQLSYRLNAAEVLARQRRYSSAIVALRAAMRLAGTPEEVTAVQTRIAWVESYRATSPGSASAARVLVVSEQGVQPDEARGEDPSGEPQPNP